MRFYLKKDVFQNNSHFSEKSKQVLSFCIMKIVDMCGVEAKRRLRDQNVASSSPALATRHIRCVLLVNSPNKLNLLSWLLIYLCNKMRCIAPNFLKAYKHMKLADNLYRKKILKNSVDYAYHWFKVLKFILDDLNKMAIL